MKHYRLDDLPLFSGLTKDDITAFIDSTKSVIKEYPKGSRLLRAMEKNTDIHLLVDGKVLVIVEDKFGNETTGHEVARGNIMGATSAILDKNYNLTSIETLTDVAVLLIPYKKLIDAVPKMARIHGIIMKNMLEAFAIKMLLMTEKLEIVATKSLRHRILLYISQQQQHQQKAKIDIPSKVQLARTLSCNRSALTRELALMVEEGLIKMDKNHLEAPLEPYFTADTI